MIAAIRSDEVPNLVLMQYTFQWKVNNLLIVPSFFFSETAIERRRPLSATTRRAGWVGCNILLKEIPPDGKLVVVAEGIVTSPDLVRLRFDQIRPLSTMKADVRGWTLNVLNVVRQIGKDHFPLSDVYAFEAKFAEAYPSNRNVRPKIRQQLQKLRDLGFLEFVGRGRYRVVVA
jgi:type II restriction enzyme